MTNLAAAITAGGRSSRFGRDKALFVWQGRTLLEHVAASLQDASPQLLIAPAGKYALPGWRVVPDRRPGEGPLAGLESALGEVDGWLAFAAVDLPHLSAQYWALLAGQRAPGVQAVCALDEAGRAQPLAALYHASLRPEVGALLRAGERRVGRLLEGAETRFVPWATFAHLGRDLFRNFNRPEDLPKPNDSA